MPDNSSECSESLKSGSHPMHHIVLHVRMNPNRSSDFHSYFVLLSAGLYPVLSKMYRATPGKSRIQDDGSSAEEG